MKKLIFVGILGLFVLGSCNNSTVTHTHDEHDHAAEGHNHEAEGPDHSHEGECSGEHNHEAADEYNEAAEAHSDEIILPKAKAEAAGVKVSVIEPAPFQQVIKTSGQVLAAQGDESVAVATVAGVVSFRGKVTEGMSVGSSTPLVTISSKNIADGDPAMDGEITAQYAHGHIAQIAHKAEHRLHQAGQELAAPAGCIELFVHLVEGFPAAFFPVEQPHHIVAAVHLFDVAVHMAQVFLLGPEVPLAAANHQGDDEEGQRQGDQAGQGHPSADGEHHHKDTQKGGDGGDHLGQALVQGGGDGVHIVGDQTEGFAVGGLVIKGQGQAVHFFVDLIPQLVGDLLGYAAH